jgi:hypothetical protein
LYRVAAGPARNGAPMRPPQCLTCPSQVVVGSASPIQDPQPPPILPARIAWDDEWDEEKEEDATEAPSTPPTRKRKEKVIGMMKFVNISLRDNRKSNERTDYVLLEIPEGPQPCLYHNAWFSPGASHYVLECLGPRVPRTTLYAARHPVPKLLMYLQNNTELQVSDQLSKFGRE